MIKRRRRAGSAPKYRNQESPRTRSISDTETNERLREEQESLERKPSLKKFYRELDPTNGFNPGIGRTSKNKNWV